MPAPSLFVAKIFPHLLWTILVPRAPLTARSLAFPVGRSPCTHLDAREDGDGSRCRHIPHPILSACWGNSRSSRSSLGATSAFESRVQVRIAFSRMRQKPHPMKTDEIVLNHSPACS